MLWLLNLDYSLPAWLSWVSIDGIIKKIEKHNLDGVNVWAGKLLTKNFISEIKKEDTASTHGPLMILTKLHY